MNIKSLIKKILGEDIDIIKSEYNEKNFPNSLKEFVKINPHVLSEYSQFEGRKDKKEFYPEIKKIENGFYLLYRDLDVYNENDFTPIPEIHTVRTGNPLKYKPFPMAKEFMLREIFNKYLYSYPAISGDTKLRAHFVNYLIREGFKKSKENYDGIGIDNIVFTCSTTHAYGLIMSTIMRNEDVIIVTGPNYGLFAITPERLNGRVEVLNLREDDDFLPNPKLLAKKIDEVNENLKKEWQGKLDYTPKVVAFLNINPHNPLGKVMNSKHINILKGIGDVCLEKSVFIIDDLVYRDLTFNQNDLAIPIATFPQYFNNTISLFGLSKAYGLAGIRSGALVAPIPICNAIKARIFSTMDSIPVIQIQAFVGAYNGTNRRYRKVKKYFPPLIKEYKYRFILLKALLEGIDTIDDKKQKNKIIKDINKYADSEIMKKLLLEGIDGVKIRENTIPESGFFAIVDFTGIIGRKYNNNLISNEVDLVKYLYKTSKFKSLMGVNFSWPYKDEIVSRFDFAIDLEDLIRDIEKLYYALNEEFVCVEK